jgi:CMP-N,N'-diacetyllegionaminic acid synthase
MSIHPVLAVIPARGGSKGVPGKNIRPLAGLPLIGHSIRLAKLCAEIAECVVSTDSAEIAEVARECGAEVPFLRPAELARDDTPMWPVLQHALSEMESIANRRYGSVLLLSPASPGRLPEDVSKAIDLLEQDQSAVGFTVLMACCICGDAIMSRIQRLRATLKCLTGCWRFRRAGPSISIAREISVLRN